MSNMFKKTRFFKVILYLFPLTVFSAQHHPQEFLDSIQGDPDKGEKIYAHFCVNCHAETPVIPVGAPRLGVESDWKARLDKAGSAEKLLKNIDAGLGAMPPRGGCFECTDEELKAAILYMLPKHV